MSIISASQSGLNGLQNGLKNLNKNTASIASNASVKNASTLTEPLVNMVSDKQQIVASVNVIKTGNELIGTLLDIKA